MASWKHRSDNKNPILHNVTKSDCDSAAKGLNMISMSISQLNDLIKIHGHGDTFASQVITTAAQQIRAVKRFNCAEE